MLGVEQRHLADLLEVVLDRVRGGAGHRYLSSGQVIVIVTIDECLVVGLLGGGSRDRDPDCHHAGGRLRLAFGVGLGLVVTVIGLIVCASTRDRLIAVQAGQVIKINF